MSSWRKLIADEMDMHGDSFEQIVSSTFASLEEELDRPFGDTESLPQGAAFTIWTKTRVYFPVVDDAGVWCGSVSRNPDGIPTPHIGWSQT